ncbi:MAG: hypothetical protein V4581_06070, partial [Bacteroidota bacterium]
MNFITDNLSIIIIVVIVAALVIGFNYYSTKAVVKRKLKKAKLKRVHEFKSGQTAKIIGRVESTGKVLVAPLSGRKCVYYYVLVEKKVSSGKSSRWDTLIEDEDETGFVLRDGNKYAYIEDRNLKSYVVDDAHYKSGFMNDATHDLEAYLNKHGHNSENYFGFNTTLRYREAVLELDEAVAAFG